MAEVNENAVNHEETEEDKGITMVDILNEEEEREMDAAAVLGGSDDTSCTYDKGHMKRQALYACITCCPSDSGILAGVCLACSLHCHEDHELIELYTKRHFRCDCGNSKFPNNICKHIKDKLPENPENVYNHNFKGVYCTCERPYPDPEDTSDDEMIQCSICEDWYHGKHQGSKVPPGDNYGEMICKLCIVKHPFLLHYTGLAVVVVKADESQEQVNVTGENSHGVKRSNSTDDGELHPNKKQKIDDLNNSKNNDDSIASEASTNKDDSITSDSSLDKEVISGCKLKVLPSESVDGALFLPDNWRKQLCTCDDCKVKYDKEGVKYLLDSEDTVSCYEEFGKSRHRGRSASVERELEALSSIDRVTRTEMVHEYNTLSTSLREFLKTFAENKKVVKGEDIKEFFDQLSANKKQRATVQQFCR